MIAKLSRRFILSLLLLLPAAGTAQGQVLVGGYADTYRSARGFDTNGDKQIDQMTVPVPGASGVTLASELGGMAAPMAYFPRAAWTLTDAALLRLVGHGSFDRPDVSSAFGFRTRLYSTTGVNALKAFYTNAIQAFIPSLPELLAAEELLRAALRIDPYYEDALNALLEIYYARAEGFTLIGNDYMAKAYKHKFDRGPGETLSIKDLELKDIESALTCYEVGFREFMKLFNPEFTGVGNLRKPDLDINAEWLFFAKRYPNPIPGGSPVAFESLRGSQNTLGAASMAFDADGNPVGPVQGSPNIELEVIPSISKPQPLDGRKMNAVYGMFTKGGGMPSKDSLLADTGDPTLDVKIELLYSRLKRQVSRWNTVDAPVKLQLPIIVGSPTYKPGSTLTLEFRVDATEAVKAMEMVLEFDYEKLTPDSSKLDLTGSAFPLNCTVYGPESTYGDTQLLANQMLIKAEAASPVSGTNKVIVRVPFLIKGDAIGKFYIYGAGSGGSLLSGYKDIAILYRLGAAHANATAEKVRRLYNLANPQTVADSIQFIQEENDRIGGWFEHLQGLLAQSATQQELAAVDQLQSAVGKVSSELGNLGSLREFIRSGANVFGFPDGYVPFYNPENSNMDTFDAVLNFVVGSENFTPQTATGFFGTAREQETKAVTSYKDFDDTKDKIRNEIFTINEQAENRLLQICGRINSSNEPSFSVNDPIDYDALASPRNLASEIGQNVLLLDKAQKQLNQANAEIKAYLDDIEIERRYLEEAVSKKQEIPGIIAQYGNMQAKLNQEISHINAEQIKRNAELQALNAVLTKSNWVDWLGGKTGASFASAAAILINGQEQARLEEKKGELQAKMTRLGAEERIKLTEIDTELFKLQEMKTIEQMVNDIVVKEISISIAEIDLQLALGQLNKVMMERDECLARRGRALANLGEMSFADPSFRLTQINTVQDASNQLEFLKRWLFVMTRALYYKWALQDDYIIQVYGKPQVSIHDVPRIQVVGALNTGVQGTALDDTLTAAEYVDALITFSKTGPIATASSVSIDRVNSNNSARYSLREDFLHLVRTADTIAESTRVREAFNKWFTSPDRLDADGNLVIDFDTMGHMENYNLPVGPAHGVWKNFALRSYGALPLWNHKITKVGVALKAVGLTFKPGVLDVQGSLQYGGSGYLKGDTAASDDFRVYSMRQWRDQGKGLEPIDYRTVPLTFPSSAALEQSEATYMVENLKDRPVTASKWRLFISKEQLANIEMANIEDVFIYIYSKAYQRQ